MRINIYAHLIIIEILDDIYAREQTWSTVEYSMYPVYRVRYLAENLIRGFL